MFLLQLDQVKQQVTLVLIIAFLLSVLLSNISARSSPTSLMAQVLLPQRKPNPCSALMQKDFAAIPDAPTAILSTQVVPATAQTPEYCEVPVILTSRAVPMEDDKL